MKRFLGEFNYYAVCVPVYESKILFEVRSENIPQPLEVSFPGGHIEMNEEPYEAALRELKEETGLRTVDFLFEVEPLVTPFNSVIYPFVVAVDINELRINTNEVKETFLVPIEHFQRPYSIGIVDVELKPREDFPFHLIAFGRNYNWKRGIYKVIFYKYGDYIIWGITAKIAQRTYELMKERGG
ncbi:NUDIX domain-containing protein [Fervidobacterium changbaicum]|uniref:CoA pyrophosphatase n=2 Tax=Fervidobacterium TaxID=2422 RepID=A0AAI8GD25_FERIS|nr:MULTISPECIES: CoA pyrophosphatase [Fervidobacterium]AMW32565.1 CoA pyrophosphatase [Fervidobacterium islandicum]QAV32584.1 CoA pyrophosphatase [Fervidobacterium changbaicum]SDH66154.1 NUDIX domain-containing protein [Fervidobacterium changbaicum]